MRKKAGLPILTYHAIDRTGAITSADPDRFAETLAALRESGHRAVDLGDWITAGRPDIPRGFAICFDDGLASILQVADLLGHHAIPATVFLLADRIGSDNAWPGQPSGIPRARLLDRSELESLADRGFRFGSHGRNHARLDRMPPGNLDRELRGSRDAIEQSLGRPCPLLAYPYGASNARVREAAAVAYHAAFGTRLAYGSASDDRSAISRIDAYYLRSPRALEALIAGRWHLGLAVRRTLRLVGSALRAAPIGPMRSVRPSDPTGKRKPLSPGVP